MDGSLISRLFRLEQEANKNLLRFAVWVMLAVVGVVGTTVTCIITGDPTRTWGNAIGRGILSFFAATCAELVAAMIIYLVSVTWFIPKLKKAEEELAAHENVVDPLYQLICQKVEELKTPDINVYKSQFHLADLNKDIEGASSIEVVVQGWDGLVRHHKDSWVEFLKKGGHVTVILPKITKDSKTIEGAMERLHRARQKQVDEIENTFGELNRLNVANGSRGGVHRCEYDKMIWYCLIRLDRNLAYLSCYEHVTGGTVDSPFLRILLDRFPLIGNWIEKEVVGMTPPITN